LPSRTWIDVELSWMNKPDFVLSLGVDADRRRDAQAFRIEAWDRDLVLLRETDREADVATIGSIVPTRNRIRLQLFLDQQAGRCVIFSNWGKRLADLKIAARMQQVLPGLRLSNKRGDVRLESLHIGRWDGVEPARVAEGMARLHLVDGTLVFGRLAGFDEKANEFIVRVDAAERRIAAGRIAALFLPADDEAQPAEPPLALVTVVGHDGTRVSGVAQRVEERSLSLFWPAVGKRVNFPWSGLDSLVVRHRDDSADPDEPRQSRNRIDATRRPAEQSPLPPARIIPGISDK